MREKIKNIDINFLHDLFLFVVSIHHLTRNLHPYLHCILYMSNLYDDLEKHTVDVLKLQYLL